MKRVLVLKSVLLALLLCVFGAQSMAESITPAPKVRTGTGFGINDFRGFNTSGNTDFYFEGQRLVVPPDASLIGLGSRVNVRLAANASAFAAVRPRYRAP